MRGDCEAPNDPHILGPFPAEMTEIARQPQQLEEPRVAEVERPSDLRDIRTTVMHACTQSGTHPSGLGHCHLQATISAPLVGDIAIFAGTILKQRFSTGSLLVAPCRCNIEDTRR